MSANGTVIDKLRQPHIALQKRWSICAILSFSGNLWIAFEQIPSLNGGKF